MLSVIVPIYNVEKYIRQCVESIINQTYRDLEIILVNDGSTDGCQKICNEYAKSDSRVIVVNKENGGLVSARKAGLKIAKGEYVTYVDGDDWIDDGAYSDMIINITSSDADVIMYGHYENIENTQTEVYYGVEPGIYDRKKMIKKLYPQLIAGETFFEWKIFPAVWDMIIKRELLEKSQFDVDDDISIGEDAACKFPCLLLANKVMICEKAYYHYRQTLTSMIKQKQNIEVERSRMNVLFRSVNRRLTELSDVFDVRNQWLAYVMFLALPRADLLYKNFANIDYLFPYTNVKRGMKIAIYGAGTYGQHLYKCISQKNFCEIIVWFDRNFEQLTKIGLDVKNPDTISDYEFDGIIVANMFSNSRKQIVDFIKQKKICEIYQLDESIIFSKEYLEGFGLI